MSIQNVLKMGNPLLHQKAELVSDIEKIETIISNMIDTMRHHHGAGIAAPQISISKRIIVYGFDFNPRYPQAKPIPLTIVINPVYEILNDSIMMVWEGCLSVPKLRAEIKRAKKIKCEGLKPDGTPFSKIVENFEAGIIQHECDHLDGILFPERIHNFKRFGFEDEISIY